MTEPLPDLLDRARAFLVQCGSCDAGLPMSCNCPDGDPRSVIGDLVAELGRTRPLVDAVLAYMAADPGSDDVNDAYHALVEATRNYGGTVRL